MLHVVRRGKLVSTAPSRDHHAIGPLSGRASTGRVLPKPQSTIQQDWVDRTRMILIDELRPSSTAESVSSLCSTLRETITGYCCAKVSAVVKPDSHALLTFHVFWTRMLSGGSILSSLAVSGQSRSTTPPSPSTSSVPTHVVLACFWRANFSISRLGSVIESNSFVPDRQLFFGPLDHLILGVPTPWPLLGPLRLR